MNGCEIVELDYESKYELQSAYHKYSGINDFNKKGKFENKHSFRKDFSCYNIKTKKATVGINCKWDRDNYGGVPMDFDKEKNIVYIDGSDSHTLLFGATGSKKSRLVVIPTVHTLAATGENMIICDPKGEIYQRTSALLKSSGYKICAINLREPQKGDGWNMLDVPYNHYLNGEIDKACEFINDATISLIPITASDPYWDFSARDMLFGLILLLFQICKDKKLSSQMVNMISVLKLREELFNSSFSSDIKKTNIWNYAKQFDLVRTRLNGIIVCPEKTLSCIVSTFDQHMTCFMLQPQVVQMLSHSTFGLDELGFQKIAIFMIMPDEKTTYHKIITIFVKQIYEFLIDNAFKNTKNNRFPIRINFLLDEFSSLPEISDFPQMISASRSRNIRFILVVQSKHQLKQRYREETETIISNCTNWMFLTSREIELLNDISTLAGTTGKNNEQLISISWLQHLNKEKGECLILSGRKHPYLATLPDIDIYDEMKYAKTEMNVRKQIEFENNYYSDCFFSNILCDEKSKELDSITFRENFDSMSPKDSEQDALKLQKELEAKFDELFGPLDDNNNDN